MICPHCCEREALRSVGLCRTCAAAQERADRRERPGYYHARSMALRIDVHDVRRAGEAWAGRPASMGARADIDHAHVGVRCVATLDGVRYHAGVIVAVEREASRGQQRRKPDVSACWVWLLKPPPADELHVPVLRCAVDRVEIVRRERESAKESEETWASRT